MSKNLIISLLLALLVFGMGFHALGGNDTLASDSIDVTVKVAVMQKVEVLENPKVEFDYPWDGASEGEPLIVKNAGTLMVKSNADWGLQLQSFSNLNFNVYVRRGDKRNSDWQPVSSSTGYFSGSHGTEEIGFDLKIKPPRTTTLNSTEGQTKGRVELSYTMEQN